MKKTKYVQLRVTPEVHESIKHFVIDIGQSIQQWVFSLIQEEMDKKAKTSDKDKEKKKDKK